MQVKLGDFGLAKEAGAMKQEHTQGVGTLGWMAPEVIEPNPNFDQVVESLSSRFIN